MARSEKNLTAVFTDTASAIRAKTGTTEQICPLDFADKINSIQTGGSGGGMKAYFEAGGKCGRSKATSFNDIIQYSDTENVKNFWYFFEFCEDLVALPNIDVSKGNDFRFMFSYCRKLKKIPDLNMNSGSKAMMYMFNYCESIETLPMIDTSNAWTLENFCSYCKNLKTIPELNLTGVRKLDGAFYNCNSLQSIPHIDAGSIDSFYNTFYGCSSISSFKMYNIKADLNLSGSNMFTRESLVEILNNLSTVTSTKTLTIGSTNLAKLTDEDKAIATNKGWTLA